MPKKKPGMTPEDQSKKFRDAAQNMVDAGELNPIEADKALDGLVRRAGTHKSQGGSKPVS